LLLVIGAPVGEVFGARVFLFAISCQSGFGWGGCLKRFLGRACPVRLCSGRALSEAEWDYRMYRDIVNHEFTQIYTGGFAGSALEIVLNYISGFGPQHSFLDARVLATNFTSVLTRMSGAI